MRLLLIRHGYTIQNEKRVQQNHLDELNEIGHKQAIKVANRMKEYGFDKLISSPLRRAFQTAKYISEQTGLEIETMSELSEVRRPSHIMGHSNDSDLVKAVKAEMNHHATDPRWYHSDEENWFDLKKRVSTALLKVSQMESTNILAVSHGVAIKMALSLALFGEHLKPLQYGYVYDNFLIENTGIAELVFANGDWKILSFNDHGHLW